ncbi:MAG: hypothetical protein NTX76_00780 [Alphaproteobacteria bacterium]|nr:hypothetical protein [Alphaproteobacteria bacterium]
MKAFMRVKLWGVLLLVTPLLLGGCADAIVSAVKSVFSLQTAKVWLEKVCFKASNDVNDGSPVTVHILIIYKPDLLAELSKMDSDAYFQKATQIKTDNPEDLDLFKYDIIRGQKLDNVPITPSKVSGEGVLIFARYSSPGAHRVAVGSEKEIIIQLDKLDFKIIPAIPTK